MAWEKGKREGMTFIANPFEVKVMLEQKQSKSNSKSNSDNSREIWLIAKS